MYKSVYNLTCSCCLLRNGNFVPFKNTGKGKRIQIYAYFDENSETMNYTKHPYLQVEPSNQKENLYQCGLYQISNINQKFLTEGKITIDVVEGEQLFMPQASDISLKSQIIEKKLAHLCLSNSTEQSLKLFVSKIKDLIQLYAEKSKSSKQNDQQTQQQSQAKLRQQEQQKMSLQSGKKIQINDMKNNVNQPQKQKDKNKDSLFKDLIDEQKQQLGNNIQKQFDKFNQSSLFVQPNRMSLKQQQLLSNSYKKDNNFEQKNKDKLNRIEEKTLEMQQKVEEKDQQQATQSMKKLRLESKDVLELGKGFEHKSENKVIELVRNQDQIQLKELLSKSQQKSSKKVQFLQSQNDIIKSSNLHSPSGQSSFELEIEAEQQGMSQSLERSISQQILKLQENDAQEIEKQKEIFTSQMINDKDKQISTQKKQSNEQQLIFNEIQPKMTQQEKITNKEKVLQNQQMMEEHEEILDQQEIQQIKQLENPEKQQLEQDDNRLESSQNKQLQKYFQEKENIESQYEQEQRSIQNENEKNLEENKSKFMSLQSKIQDLKHKQHLKNTDSIQKIQQQNKNFYKVDRSQTRQSFNFDDQQNISLKRKNPFSCGNKEDKDPNKSQDLYAEVVKPKNSMDIQNQTLSFKKNNNNNDINKFQITQSNKNNNQLFKLKEGNTPADLPNQPVKKLGGQFVFERNSKEEDRKKQILQQNNNIYKQFLELPEHVIIGILIFIKKEEILKLRIVSKFFNDAVFLSIRKLTFNKRDTPSEHVVQMLNKIKYLTHLQLGDIQNIKAETVLEKVDISKIKSLQVIDFSNFQNITSKLLTSFVKSSKQLKDISIPYFKINDELLMQLHGYLNNLQRIALLSGKDGFTNNEKIGDVGLAKMITDNNNMRIFEVFTTTPFLFDKIEQYEVLKREKHEEKVKKNTELGTLHMIKDQDDVYSRMQCFKIRNLVMTRFSEDDLTKREKNLNNISKFTNLKTLKIVNIVKKAKGEWFLPHTLQVSTVETIFSNCKKIQELCLGQWCTNEILFTIAQQIECLIKIRLIGNSVDDQGLEYVFLKMNQLETINIVDATRINGHCFESIISRRIKEIKVKFDDFRLNCLHSTVTHQLELEGVKITNYTK